MAGILWDMPEKEAEYRIKNDGFTKVESVIEGNEVSPTTEKKDETSILEEEKQKDEVSLESLHSQYLEKFRKEVPVNKKNDAEWIQSKLSE